MQKTCEIPEVNDSLTTHSEFIVNAARCLETPIALASGLVFPVGLWYQVTPRGKTVKVTEAKNNY